MDKRHGIVPKNCIKMRVSLYVLVVGLLDGVWCRSKMKKCCQSVSFPVAPLFTLSRVFREILMVSFFLWFLVLKFWNGFRNQILQD